MTTCEIQICVECRHPSRLQRMRGAPGGTVLLATMERLLKGRDWPEDVATRPVSCMGNCSRRCRVSVVGEGRWTWTLGDIHPQQDGQFLVDFIAEWLAADTGLIPKARRSKKLKGRVLGRISPRLSQ